MKLSIIIPYHKTLELCKNLLEVLIPQLTSETEIIIIDDDIDTYELDKYKSNNVKVIHHEVNSGCAGKPRNTGLDNAIGKKIVFIDSDDMVSNNYIEKILHKIEMSNFDYCFFSWKFTGKFDDEVIISDFPPEWNCCVWNCIYSKDRIGRERFNETMKIAEDYDFNIRVRKGKKENLLDVLYYYNDSRDGSLSNDKNLVPMIKTKKYTNIFYFRDINEIGGVETFFWEIAKKYCDNDITIFYKTGDNEQIKRLKKLVRTIEYRNEKVECEKVFFNYYFSDVIDRFNAKEKCQVIHTDYSLGKYKPIVDNRLTGYIAVSNTVAKSFEELTGIKAIVIYNPITMEKPKKCLLLVSATRLSDEKGKDKIIEIGNQLNEYGDPYLWLIFTTDTNAINNPNIVYMKPKLDIRNHLAKADFVVQTSRKEAYCYTLVEALSLGVPVIATEMPVLEEIGLNENNSIILKQDLSNLNVKEFYTKEFNFKYTPPEDKWGDYIIKSKSTYKEELNMRYIVEALPIYKERNMTDIILGRIPEAGEQWEVDKERLDILLGNNTLQIIFVKLIKEIKPIKETTEDIQEKNIKESTKKTTIKTKKVK